MTVAFLVPEWLFERQADFYFVPIWIKAIAFLSQIQSSIRLCTKSRIMIIHMIGLLFPLAMVRIIGEKI